MARVYQTCPPYEATNHPTCYNSLYILDKRHLSVDSLHTDASTQDQAAMSNPGAHVLIFPYPAQGHMLPLLDLTHQLFLRNLTITILVTPKNLPILTPLLSLHPSIKTLVLPFPTTSSIPSGVENVKDLPITYFRPMMRVLSELHNPVVEWFKSHPSPPVAIISDFFLGWTHHLAAELGIPRVVFSPSAAMALLVFDSLFRYIPKQDEETLENSLISFPTIPNSPAYPWWQLYLLYRSYKEGEKESEFIKDGFLTNSTSWGLIVNSFDEMESVYLDFLMKNFKHEHVWAVGPLLPSDRITSHESNHHVFSWLDTCPDNSVVYLCFGSQSVLSNKQMEAVADGLEQSGIRFVWCVKEPTVCHAAGEYGKVPDGFEKKMAGKGVVIRGWAPQVLILKHQAVGVFMTHCGWNSVLEAITAGVSMLAWPMTADQYINATLLVDQLGVATRVCEGAGMVPNAVELAHAVVKSVIEDSLERVRAMELHKAALGAIKEGGNSFKDLDALAKTLSQLP